MYKFMYILLMFKCVHVYTMYMQVFHTCHFHSFYIHVYTCTCICVYMGGTTCTCTCACWKLKGVATCIQAYTHTSTLARAHTHTHVYTYTATQHLLCPPTSEAVTDESSCQTECYEDRQCHTVTGSNSTMCCPTSTCGRQCVTALSAPHHPPILGCPELREDTVGACWENCGQSCPEGQLCCSNGCGHDCVPAVPVTPVCRAITESRNGSYNIGEYAPQCDNDGTFLPAQCHGSSGYCWCVRPDTGEPVGRKMTRFYAPECRSKYSMYTHVQSLIIYTYMYMYSVCSVHVYMHNDQNLHCTIVQCMYTEC